MERDTGKIPKLRRDALDAFLAVKDRPKDREAQETLAAFISSGPEARRAYGEIAAVWMTAERRRRRRATRRKAAWVLGAALAFAVTLSAIWPDWVMMPDHMAGLEPLEVAISSGTTVTLDAGTALSHQTSSELESITIRDGSAFFEVDRREQPLEVKVGPLSVAVLGTAFDVSLIDGGARVAVAEGRVEVTWPTGTSLLSSGEILHLAGGASQVVTGAIAPASIGLWRRGQLRADNHAFSEIADILDRRIRGPVIIVGGAIAEKRLSGTFELSEPLKALELAANTVGGRVLALPMLTLVTLD